MPRIEPALLPVVVDMERGFRELGVRFAIVGALVPELLLAARPRRMTRDADAAVVVESLADFHALKGRLAQFGFTGTPLPYRLAHRDGGTIDILPFSESIAPGDRLTLEDGVVLNMAGFRHVVPNAIPTAIDGGPTLPVSPVPLYALLKLIAFGDRRAPKDLAGVFHCLKHYGEQDDRRYTVDHEGAGVPFEYTTAYLLGLDARRFVDPSLRRSVTPVLDGFSGPEAVLVGTVVREEYALSAADEYRTEVFELFEWFRRGADL